MESLGREIAYPTAEQIYEINRHMVERYGGYFDPPHNVSNASALDYILQAVSSPVFSSELYPTLKEKAAALAFHIITRHVFMDVNKRTGIHTAWEFLHANGVDVTLDESIVDLAEGMARGTRDFHDLLEWLHHHQPK